MRYKEMRYEEMRCDEMRYDQGISKIPSYYAISKYA
jgi:hypothetical protein